MDFEDKKRLQCLLVIFLPKMLKPIRPRTLNEEMVWYGLTVTINVKYVTISFKYPMEPEIYVSMSERLPLEPEYEINVPNS